MLLERELNFLWQHNTLLQFHSNFVCMHTGACARVFKFSGRHKNISTYFLNNYIYFRIIYKTFNDISIAF